MKEKGVIRIDEPYLLETFGSLKIRNFGYTPKSMSSSVYSFCTLVPHIFGDL